MNEIKFVYINQQLADILSKALAYCEFDKLVKRIVTKVHDDDEKGLAHERSDEKSPELKARLRSVERHWANNNGL